MQRTLWNTPIIQPLFRLIALACARLLGWKLIGPAPSHKKAVFIGAPHTSNWDFMVMLMAILIWRLDMRWVAKHTLFKGPMGILMRYLGGIAIDRSSSVNFVGQMTQRFQHSEQLLLVITPEGTRSPVERWKTGFFYIAKEANVPMVFAYLDFSKKALGILCEDYASDDAEQAIARYQAMYQNIPGKNPKQYYGYCAGDKQKPDK